MKYNITATLPIREGVPVTYDLGTGWRATRAEPAPGDEALTAEILSDLKILNAETEAGTRAARALNPFDYVPFAALPGLIAVERFGMVKDLAIDPILSEGEQELADAGDLQF